MLEFDEPTHTYTLDGQVIPSVTQILKPLDDYSNIPAFILEQARERGEYVHKACELYVWGTLDLDEVDEDYRPYIDSFILFIEETGFIAESVEQKIYHPKMKYAGTVDLQGIIPASGKNKDVKVLVDTKATSKIMPAVGPQTAGYLHAWNALYTDNQCDSRYVLHLKKDGYEFQLLKSSDDLNVFFSCLNIHNFITRNQK